MQLICFLYEFIIRDYYRANEGPNLHLYYRANLHLYPCKHVTSLMKAPICVFHIIVNLCCLDENMSLMAKFKAKHYISLLLLVIDINCVIITKKL